MSSLSNIRTGPCEIFIDGASVGATEGDVIFSPGMRTRPQRSAHYGENIIDIIHMGQAPQVTFRFAEYTLANIEAWLPEGRSSGNSRYFGYKPGRKMGDRAVRLTLRPVKANGNAEDIVLFKAVPNEPASIGLNSENDRVFEATWTGLIDASRADGELIGYLRVPTGT